MGCIGNIVWIVCGGFIGWLSWFIAGCLWCMSIIGIPVGLQCFKMARLSFAPFGKRIIVQPTATGCVLNIIWVCVSGFWLALGHVFSGLFLCITVIGIPFAYQSFKLARLALAPFGVRVA